MAFAIHLWREGKCKKNQVTKPVTHEYTLQGFFLIFQNGRKHFDKKLKNNRQNTVLEISMLTYMVHCRRVCMFKKVCIHICMTG